LPFTAKSYEFAKSFLNRRDRLWPAFKKSASWLCLAFKIGELAMAVELALAGFQNRRESLAGFQKLLAQLREICYPVGATDLNSTVLISF
jgi:hypothetical protein